MEHGNKQTYVTGSRLYQGYFGRIFRNLDALKPSIKSDEHSEDILKDLANKMIASEEEDANSALDNTCIPAGYTYFGQFVDHDLTFDPTSRLDRFNDPDKLNNFRTASFDLDNIYGRGSEDSPYLYEKDNTKLLIHKKDNGEEDLIRNANEVAIIGDKRNDENTLVSQIQLAFIKFHNTVVDKLIKEKYSGPRSLLDEARRIVTWHYQWVGDFELASRF